MATQKYDISKSFKLSNENIANLAKLQRLGNFKSDSEVVRYALNLAVVLNKKGLEKRVLSQLLEISVEEDK